MEDKKSLVFLSTPITNAIDRITGCFDKEIELRIRQLAEKIRNKGYDLFLAIEQEEWGKAIAMPDTCTPRDYNNLIESKSLVVYLSECFSAGTYIEIGWASARNIPITILCQKGMKLSPLLLGLEHIGDNKIYYVDFNELQVVEAILNERL